VIRYHARWVLPVHSAPLRDATVAVDGDTIAWVGSRAGAPPGEDVELGDAVVIPGLVNTHIHLDLSAFAGVMPRSSFFGWVRTLVDGLTNATDTDALGDVARWTVAEQLSRGVTTMAHTGPNANTLDALIELGARGVAFIEVFGPDPASCDTSMLDLRAKVRDARARETSLARVGVSPHAPYSVSDALYAAVGSYAIAEGIPVAVHIAESRDETHLVRHGSGEFAEFLRGRGIAVAPRGTSPVDVLDRAGLLRARPLCIHAIELEDDDIARIAASGASVAHCPRANAWLGHGIARVPALVAAGVPVGLGTDSAASNDGLDLLAEARAAAGDLSPAQRLTLATSGGARALGMAQSAGELREGLQADLAVFRVRDTHSCDADPVSYVLERCLDSATLLTLVAGRVRVRGGVVDGVGPEVTERMQRHRSRVRAWRDGVANADNTFLDSVP
jgi:cytosine/adenosine deaminase-related metal-dependent hydrolase